jgi:hypothetical protein
LFIIGVGVEKLPGGGILSWGSSPGGNPGCYVVLPPSLDTYTVLSIVG